MQFGIKVSLIEEILRYRSVSVVGMEKNTGKTELLNYILRKLPADVAVAVTSIGTDGESTDIVTGTRKPEITLREGMVFATAEKYYARRRLSAEILSVGGGDTAAGRIVTARALSTGKVIISGPSSSAAMKRWMASLNSCGVDLTLVDGALSRLSSASPAVSEAMILSTGAALSTDMKRLVRETAHTVEMMRLLLADADTVSLLNDITSGVWCIGADGELKRLDIASSLSPEAFGEKMPEGCAKIYVSGALTDRFAEAFRAAGKCGEAELVVRDFTKIFLSSKVYAALLRAGGRIKVLESSDLLAVTVNPVSPNGMVLDAGKLIENMAGAVDVPVYDIMNSI